MRQIPEFINNLAIELNKNEMPFREYISTKEDEFNKIVSPYLV